MGGKDGKVVPEGQPSSGGDGGLIKKAAGSWSWMLINASGQEMVLDVDKYSIMHRVQIHARDLRILDPLLSYPSTILGREKAIVLNLEVKLFTHIYGHFFKGKLYFTPCGLPIFYITPYGFKSYT